MFEGIITPIVTPFHRDAQESINYEATKQLIDHLIEHGVKGIFILGSNGEFHVIDEEEKVAFAKRVIEIVIEENGGTRSRCAKCDHTIFLKANQCQFVCAL
mgnify:CR=1 FL=1